MGGRRSRVIWVATAAVAGGCAFFAGAWFSSGVTGEIFLVDSTGRVQTATGADIAFAVRRLTDAIEDPPGGAPLAGAGRRLTEGPWATTPAPPDPRGEVSACAGMTA